MIDFGYFPQRRVETWEVEELMDPQPTGRSYTKDNYIEEVYDYKSNSRKDVSRFCNYCPEFRLKDGRRVVRYKTRYYEVEPISWVIENWEEIFNGEVDNTQESWGIGWEDFCNKKVANMRLSLPRMKDKEFALYCLNFKQAFVVAPELLKLSGVKNIDYLIEESNQDECEKVL